MKSLDFALLLSKYLTQYLPAQRNLSSNTICSYRDTFKLLLIFCRDIQGFNIAKLPMTQLDRKCIEDFILWLRNIRKSSPSTCNQRLCAIHAFFDYVMVEEPQLMEQCIQIHNIPRMVSSAPPAKYLTPDALRCLLAIPDITTPKGRRHLVLLTVLYDTAARVSELADIRMRDVRLDSPAAITLHGKGGKVRTVPLMKQTVELLQSYFTENGITPQKSPDMPLFWSGNYRKLTRSGITYIVQKYAAAAQAISTDIPATISPHVFRHTKAMHLVQANVNTIYIKDYLGHADISTTEVYGKPMTLSADAAQRRRKTDALLIPARTQRCWRASSTALTAEPRCRALCTKTDTNWQTELSAKKYSRNTTVSSGHKGIKVAGTAMDNRCIWQKRWMSLCWKW